MRTIPKPNRLQLDFKLETQEERNDFLTTYLESPTFQNTPPTPDELDMMAKYVLWGKRSDGKNEVQHKNVQLSTRSQLWHKNDSVTEESLDALLESPTFKETQLTHPPAKRVREVFDRKKALDNVPDYLRADLEVLFNEIDTLDLQISFYEIQHAKRTNPPRTELLQRFSEEEQRTHTAIAAEWNQHKYLKKRHLLVELRRQQYTFADSFIAAPLQLRPTPDQHDAITLTLGSEIQVLPAGLKQNQLFFGSEATLTPNILSPNQTNDIIHQFWKQRDPAASYVFDFRELEHVYQLICFMNEWQNDTTLDDTINQLIDTLNYYIELANLNEVQQFIINEKIKKTTNVDITIKVKEQFNKLYSPNYISTIFRQKIIPKINDAAAYHEQLIMDLPNEEMFKKCTRCGRILYKHPRNFIRRSSTKDGYGARCKMCEHEIRRK